MIKLFEKNRIIIEIILVVLIITLGAFLRFYQLDEIPLGVYPDEAANGINANQVADGENLQVFFQDNGGREGLYIYITAGMFKLFGSSVWALHATSVIIGILTLILFYLLAKELFGRKIGLIALFLFSISTWHITLSRDGFRGILVPLITVGLLYFLIKAYRSKKTIFWIISGAFLGLGAYTYIAFRMVPLILVLLLLYYYFIQKNTFWKRKNFRRGIIILLISTFIIITPFLIHSISHPEDFIGRAGGVSIFNPDLWEGGFVKTAFMSVVKTLGMFNFAGDNNFRHNLASMPMLNFWVGILFLWGILISVINFKKSKYFLLLAGLLTMLLPATLTAEGVPHALRAIGTLPFVFLLAALPFKYFFRIKQKRFLKYGLAILGIVFLGSITYDNYTRYFVTYAEKPEVYSEFRSDLRELGEYLNDHHPNDKIFVALDSYSDQSLEFITYKQAKYDLLKDASASDINGLIKNNPATFYLVLSHDFLNLSEESEVLQSYPVYKSIKNKFDENIFKVYRITNEKFKSTK